MRGMSSTATQATVARPPVTPKFSDAMTTGTAKRATVDTSSTALPTSSPNATVTARRTRARASTVSCNRPKRESVQGDRAVDIP